MPQNTNRSTRQRDPLPPLLRLQSVAPEPVHWLSPGRLAAGKITLLDGDPGVGKSTLLCEFAARVSRGQPLPAGQPDIPRNVLLVSAEDDLYDTIRPRFDAAGGDPSRVITIPTIPLQDSYDDLLVFPDHTAILARIITHFNAALVVIDPLAAFLSPRLNAASDQAVRRALAGLKGVAERTGAALVAVRHLNKASASHPLYRGGGSIGIIGAARCALLLAPDPGDPDRRILAATKSNLGLLPPALAFRLEHAPGAGAARVVWEGESPWRAADLLRPPEQQEHPWSALSEAREWLRAALASGPRPAHDLLGEALQAGIARGTLYAAKKAEGVRAHKAHIPGGHWTWSPAPTDDCTPGAQRDLRHL